MSPVPESGRAPEPVATLPVLAIVLAPEPVAIVLAPEPVLAIVLALEPVAIVLAPEPVAMLPVEV